VSSLHNKTIDGKVTFLTRRPWYSIPGLALAAPGLRNDSVTMFGLI
jgi:hypothetical protein